MDVIKEITRNIIGGGDLVYDYDYDGGLGKIYFNGDILYRVSTSLMLDLVNDSYIQYDAYRDAKYYTVTDKAINHYFDQEVGKAGVLNSVPQSALVLYYAVNNNPFNFAGLFKSIPAAARSFHLDELLEWNLDEGLGMGQYLEAERVTSRTVHRYRLARFEIRV